MTKAITDLLYFENLIGSIQEVVGGVPEDILPPQFLSVTERTEGKQGKYVKVAGTREAARFVHYGSPAKKRALSGIKEVPVSLLHTFESLTVDPTALMQLRDETSMVRQEMGRQTIARNLADFGVRFRNLRVSTVYSVFKQGAIYFDEEGNLLPDSTGALYDINFGIPAGNKDQLDVLGAGDIIAASWAVAGTKIVDHVRALKRAARKKTGYQLRHAFYGPNIPGYLLGNDQIKAYIAASPRLSEAIVSSPGEIPQGLLGLNWHPMDEAFYVDDAGAFQDWFTGDEITFTPDPSPDWWGFLEGTYPVPTTLDIVSDAMAALSSLTAVAGPFSYAKMAHNPPSLEHFAGDTFLPVLKNPWAIFQADVTP